MVKKFATNEASATQPVRQAGDAGLAAGSRQQATNSQEAMQLKRQAKMMAASPVAATLQRYQQIAQGGDLRLPVTGTTADAAVLQPKLAITSSPLSPFSELKYSQFQSLNKRYKEQGSGLSVDAWQIMRSMAKSPYQFTYSTWAACAGKAMEIHQFGPDGFKYFTEYQRSGKADERTTILQPGYATGDQFGIAATLILDPKMDVMISSGPKSPQALGYDPTDKAESIRDFYLESGIPSWRIHLAATGNVRDSAAKDMWNTVRNLYQSQFGLDLSSNSKIKNRTKAVNYGTDYIAGNWSDAAKNKVRTAWNVNASKDPQIATWLTSRGVPVAGQNIAILWSRFSGKKGDIHLEHDTSYMGIRQIVMAAARHYTAIIIAGDPSATPDSVGKYSQIAKNFGLNIFNLTGFWSDKTPMLTAWGGNTRTGQFKLYDYLARNFALKHLGSRSGNLETMAMLGHQVRYMEETDSIGGERMAKWHAHGGTPLTTSGGLATGYERLMLEQPATRSGKYLKANMDTEGKRPLWASGRPGATPKPLPIKNLEKGFGDNDMQAIRHYLDIPAKRGNSALSKFNRVVQLDLSTVNDHAVIKTLLAGLVRDKWFPSLQRLSLNGQLGEQMSDHLKLLQLRGIRVSFA